jgi:gliding motility-associated-like protein
MLLIPLETFSQLHTSRNNFQGDWETPSTWNPVWTPPVTSLSGTSITINGFVTANGPVSFTGTSSKLIVNDTLVIKGDLTLGDNNDLLINDNGILIIRGSLNIGNQTFVTSNGYTIITGNFNKISSAQQGSFTSNQNPEKVFIGGTINPLSFSENNPLYPALDCMSETVTKYTGTNCAYGNMDDLRNDQVYTFFQTTCIAPKPVISAGGPLTFCEGSSVALTSSAGTSYIWSTGATTSSISVSSSGKYSVKIINAAGCLSAPSDQVEIRANAIPVTPVIVASGPTSVCSGGSVTLTSSPGSAFSWSNGATTASISTGTAGSYAVRITDSNGCTSASSLPVAIAVDVPSVPVITAHSATAFCSGGSVILSSSDGSSYLWSTGATTKDITVTNAGNYSVRITDSYGCTSAYSAATAISVYPLPVVNAGADITIPYGTSSSLNATVSGTGPFTYSWTPSTSFVNPTVEDPTTVNLVSTASYVLTATSTTTSCQGKDDITIKISGGPLSSSPAASPSTVCAGNPVQLRCNAGGGSGTYSYSWTSLPAGFTSTAENPVVSPAITTTYSVTVSDGFNNSTSSVSVTVNPVPATPVITPDSPTEFCSGSKVKLTSSAGSTYIWSTGETTQTIEVATSGTFTVKTTNASGCISPSSMSIDVTADPTPVVPTVTADGPLSFCDGGSVNLSSVTGDSYLWSGGQTTRVINVTTAGNYSLRIISSKGCQSSPSAPVTININPSPAVPVITAASPLTFCEGDNVLLSAGEANSFLWSDGSTDKTLSVTKSGSYSVTVISINGCKSPSSQPVSVNVNPLPAIPVITASGPLIFCSGGNVKLTSSSGNKYNWSDGSSTLSTVVTDGMQIYVTVTDVNGCQNTSALTKVTVNPLPVANAGPDQDLAFAFETTMGAILNESETGEWKLISGSARINDRFSPVSSVTNLQTGENIFKWIVKNEFCESNDEMKITVAGQFVPSVITPNGDGKNDYFRIGEYKGKVDLIIINRWGNEEFSAIDYQNNWDGRTSRGNVLPPDTYFYILKFDNGKVLKGSVLIKR